MFTLLISLSFGSNQSLQEVCRDTTPKSEDLTFVLLALYPYLNKQAKIQPNNQVSNQTFNKTVVMTSVGSYCTILIKSRKRGNLILHGIVLKHNINIQV